jgi:hypothetical protein
VRPYGTPGGWPTSAQGDSFGGGANFFEGGNAAQSTGVQTVSLAADAAAISSGAVRADLGAHLGGFATDDDQATVTVSWLDGSGTPTGASLVVGPVTAAERGNATELQRRTATAPVPSNARQARVLVTITRADGANNDGYADNLSLVLTDTRPPPPPPGGFDPTLAPINLFPPQIGSDVRAGQTVGCLSGMWTLDPSFAYAWTIDGRPVPGAVQQWFAIPRNARGRKLSCAVTAIADGRTARAASDAIPVLGKAGCLPIAGKRKCLRRRQRCKPSLRRIYRRSGFECKRRGKRRRLVRASPRVLRGASMVRYGRNGLPTFADAKRAFDRQIGDLPGVKQKRGAVGASFEGTAALGWMLHYRSRLTPRQRAIVDGFTKPTGVRKAGSPAINTFRGLVPEATARLKAHGISIKRGVTVRAGPVGDAYGRGKAAATAHAAWLYGDGEGCVITIGPLGEPSANDNTGAREIIAHELIHCAQAELAASGAQWNKRQNWVTEGGATWGGGRVALEWTGTLGGVARQFYGDYLQHPEKDLYGRDYDGVGWYQLLEHQGADTWRMVTETMRMGLLFGPYAAYYTGINSGAQTLEAWGPTLATNPTLGDEWNLKIPGYPIPRTLLEAPPLTNGRSSTFQADQRGGLAAQVPLRADVVLVEPGGAPVGRFRPSDGGDRPLRPAEYCARPGGCECPDGTDPGLEQIKRGDAYVGFHGLGPAAVDLRGMSVEEWCGKPHERGVNIYRLTNGLGPEPLVGTIKAGNCKRARDGFTARAKSTNGDWNLLIRIAGFEGFGRDYLLAYGEGDPWFRLDGPDGPYSNVFPVPGRPNGGAIAFNGKGSGFGFGFVPTFNRDRSAGVAIAGGMKCRYRGRRG